jgi:methionine-gamma-lyase
MAAVAALLFTFLKSGDHIVASDVCYAGTQELIGRHLPRFGVSVSMVDNIMHRQIEGAREKRR